jgi:hypothetical protein
MKRILTLSIASVLTMTLSVAAIAPESNRAALVKEIEVLYKQLREKEQKLLGISPQDRSPYEQFLAQQNTGIFRILSRDKYTGKMLTISGGGSYYSFIRLTNEYGYGSDLTLINGRFSTSWGGGSIGLISLLGDVPLESITLEHPATEFLKTASSGKDSIFRQVQQQRQNGVRQGEFTYTKEVAAMPNTTYLLRSIENSGTDILIALRVVKRDVDESLVVLWKMLKIFPAPLNER